MLRRSLLCAALIAAAGAAVPAASAAPAPVLIRQGAPEVLPPMSADLARALNDAALTAAAHGDDLGPAWVDRATGTLVVSYATPAGERLAGRLGAGVARRVVRAPRSVAALDAMRHDVTTLGKGELPGAEGILAVGIDEENARLLVQTDSVRADLMAGLAQRYGADAVTLRVIPGKQRAVREDRGNDTSPFDGGARINTPIGQCTSAFGWERNGAQRLITAGHCITSGGNVTTGSAAAIGSVTSGTDENFNTGTGTVILSGQSTYYGDVARINIASGSTAATAIFTGATSGATSAAVKKVTELRPVLNELFCVSGATTGEHCNFSVTDDTIDVYYGNGEWARNLSEGWNTACLTGGGDSGAPVYAAVTGGVALRGVHSGRATASVGCYVYFTDVWRTWDAFGGFPKMPLTTLADRRNGGEQIQQNWQLRSPNGVYTLRMQGDGNLVLSKSGLAKWSTGTSATGNQGAYAEMQTDGNFVVYRPGRVAVWSSGTSGRSGAYLRLQDDCNLVVYNSNGTAAWASNTAGC